ncbi:MAG: DMT family transporter [bacterium]
MSKGIFYLIIALFTYGFTHITDKLGIEAGVDPAVFTFFRISFAMVFVGILWFSLRKKKKLQFKKADIKQVAIIGMLASGLMALLSIQALEYTTATNKGIMQGLYTSATLVIAFLWIKERFSKLFYPTFAVMIFGLILLTSNGFMQLPNKGDWLLFLTIPMVGFCNVYAKKIMSGLHSLTVSFGRFIFGSLFLLLALPFIGLDSIHTVQYGILWVICSGVLTSIRVVSFYKGIQEVGPGLAATILAVSPAITAISDHLIIGTSFSSLQVVGLVLVLGSAFIVARLKASYK